MAGYVLLFPWMFPLALLLICAVVVFTALGKIPGLRKLRHFIAPAIALAGLLLIMSNRHWGSALLLFGLSMTIVYFAVPESFPEPEIKAKKDHLRKGRS